MPAVPHVSIAAAGLFMTLLLAACVTNERAPEAPLEGALVSGRVAGSDASGLRVRAYGLDPSGALISASPAVTTSAGGHYTLRATLSPSATALVVHVENGPERSVLLGRAAVDADVRAGEAIVLAPIDAASTYAARVVIALEAREERSIDATSAVSLFLSPTASAPIALSDASVADGAQALADARETFALALHRASSGAGSLPLALGHVAAAEARLAIALDAAATARDAEAAYTSYLDAVREGIASADFTTEQIALASLAAGLDARLGASLTHVGAIERAR